VEAGASSVLLACTGSFPPFDVDVPVVLPEAVLQATVAALYRGGPVLVFTPDAAQVEVQKRRWQTVLGASAPLIVEPENPYLEDPTARFTARAGQVAAWAPHMIVFDCIGYDHAMAEAATSQLPSSTPVLVARTLAVRIALALTT
jgi:protein AroM